MFFSIIVPTYNPSKYLPKLLNSITQNECRNEIEVIISDDKSTENFDNILAKYEKLLHIKKIEQDTHFGAPVRGRQCGTKLVSGEWFCFSDQDDYFEPNIFDILKDTIIQNNIRNYLITDFHERSLEDNVIIQEHNNDGAWTHGKFYQKSFWDKYNLHYPNVRYCEDIALSVVIQTLIDEYKIDNWYLPIYSYNWMNHSDSLSCGNGFSSMDYFYLSFPDYTRSTIGFFVEKLNNKDLSQEMKDYCIDNFINDVFLNYFYIQGMIYQNQLTNKEITKMEQIIANYLKIFLKNQNQTYNDLKILMQAHMEQYNIRRAKCVLQIPMIETEPFFHWLKRLCK